jgi:DNA-directed RNA polymerase subunit RPC12/RpoP
MKEALGISVGDKVWTEYGTGPYRVDSIRGPYWWWQHCWFDNTYGGAIIYPYPIIGLGLTLWGKPKDAGYIINDVHQEGEQWCDQHGSEVFVEKHAPILLKQFGLFDLVNVSGDPRQEPYRFDPDVDYSDPRLTYKCARCKRDFNLSEVTVAHCARCKYCGGWSERVLVVPAAKLGMKSVGAYVMALNCGAPI